MGGGRQLALRCSRRRASSSSSSSSTPSISRAHAACSARSVLRTRSTSSGGTTCRGAEVRRCKGREAKRCGGAEAWRCGGAKAVKR
eukprot:scaffold41936_cov33-Phaeocystis_antarctica.AAC.1